MSLLTWFSRKARASFGADSSGLSRIEATRPFRHGSPQEVPPAAVQARAQPSSRRTERMDQRERLYSVVRESMVRSGVLSSGYKFKVLSLDARGRQFLVMMDLAGTAGHDPHRLSEIEVRIAQNAKTRFGILVSAVYWRLNDHVAIGQPQVRSTVVSAPAPLASAPAPLMPASAPAPSPRFEPIAHDEVEAFRRALAASAASAPVPPPDLGLVQPKPSRLAWPKRNTPRRTGYEDTEAFDPQEHNPAALSVTQYGELH